MQPKLFEVPNETVAIEDVLLYALGDFQSRAKILADRELAFDRLHGAFVRACKKFGIAELSDEMIVRGLRDLGAVVTDLANFVAKRPYRIKISRQIADRCMTFYLNAASKRQSMKP